MALLTPDQIPLFLLLVLPGFISRKVYDLQVPSAGGDAARYAMDALFYGTMNAGIWIWPLTRVSSGWFWPLMVVALVISPVLLSAVIVRILKSPKMLGWTRHPLPMAWDYFFARGVPTSLKPLREGYQPRDQRGYSPAAPPTPPRPPQGGTAVVNAPTAPVAQGGK